MEGIDWKKYTEDFFDKMKGVKVFVERVTWGKYKQIWSKDADTNMKNTLIIFKFPLITLNPLLFFKVFF